MLRPINPLYPVTSIRVLIIKIPFEYLAAVKKGTLVYLVVYLSSCGYAEVERLNTVSGNRVSTCFQASASVAA